VSEDIRAAPAGLGPGLRIAGYVLEEQIGQGGMAMVFRAREEGLDRHVALKIRPDAAVCQATPPTCG
jgi:serine/threonine protein kinase